MQKEILVFGANGQLGQSIKQILVDSDKKEVDKFYFLSSNDADITKIEKLEEIFEKFQPKYIINCAAYTKVDLAEDEKEEANSVNCYGAKNLAVLCEKYKCDLIHISTDFVFDGKSIKLLDEDGECEPINFYGLSKLKGEKEIQNNLKRYFIIRTSWLYSEFGNNFVKTMLRLSEEKSSLNVVEDQIGTPTYAKDLANFILHLIDVRSEKYGVYHYSNLGLCSWYDFAKSIFEYSDSIMEVNPVSSIEYITKAKRPKFSVMSKRKVLNNFDIEIKHWRGSLKQCLSKIN